MDESLQELENELKALQPRRAPDQWTGRIRRELAAEVPAPARPRYTSATNLASWKWFGWRAAGVAAALALVAAAGLISLNPPAAVTVVPVASATPPPAQPVERYEPVAATNVLYELKDEGPVQTEAGAAARQVRARYVDTYTWKNPRTNASLKWSVPREEVRVLPASYSPN